MSSFTSALVLAFATIVALLWCCTSLFLRLLRHKHTKAILAQLATGKMDSNVPIKDRPGTMIGAWGFQFFECDHDYDIVNHLSADMGLCDFNPKPKMRDSLLNPRDKAFVIKHLRKEIDAVFKKYHGMLKDYKIIDIKEEKTKGLMLDSPRYYIFLLGLLAMQLGVPLSMAHRRWMKANWNGCLFMYERIDQAKNAAFEYENGKPFDLGSQTLSEKMMACTTTSSGINVRNNAIYVSTMRMHLDNQVAKEKGATAHKGADISTTFADVSAIPALVRAAFEKIRNGDAEKNATADVSDKDVSASAKGMKIYSWGSNATANDRLKDHDKGPLQRETLNTADMAKKMAEILIKEGEFK